MDRTDLGTRAAAAFTESAANDRRAAKRLDDGDLLDGSDWQGMCSAFEDLGADGRRGNA